MKILQVISWGYLAGGAEKSVLLLQENLASQGHEVKIVSSDHNKKVKHFSDIEFPEIDSPTRSLFAKLLYHLWYPASYHCIRNITEQYKPDVIHFHTMGQLSPSALFAIGKTPAFLTVHGPEEYVSGILEWMFPPKLFKNKRVVKGNFTLLGKGYYLYHRYIQRPVYKLGIRHLTALIAPSKYMEDVLQKENYGTKVLQTYNGIELPKTKNTKKNNRLLYVGRLERVKGVHVLLEAMNQVVTYYPETRLDIIGDGSERQELEEYVAKNNLEQNITFHGWLSNEAVVKELQAARIVVIPSVWPENLPTVCIEALASGCPVIGSRTGGIIELIQDGITGQIVPPNDHRKLAQAITTWLPKTPSTAISKRCIQSAQRYSIDTFTLSLERIYESTQA